MDLFFRFFAFIAVAIIGAGASTQRHFSVIRVACIAVDIVIPLLSAGQAAQLEVKMDDPNSSSSDSGSGAPHETQQQKPSPSDGQHSGQPPQEPSAASSAEQAGAEEAANQAALNDLREHGTQMTKAERKRAEEYLRAKYGATDPQSPSDEAR
ncbi:hypothetical protein, conserved [Eimeria praecox]|uniref:Uncharacterized protein n=1 Tax=Eimeria praecox TaxID=51316 RepID=U6G5K4_9EIME|nr:hypothetical protein, conserved [Eimeria praecox]